MPFQKGHKTNLGTKRSEETKIKMSIAHKGHPAYPKAVAKLLERNKGNKYALGQVRSPETLKKMSVAQTQAKWKWKGENATYGAKHFWVRFHWGRPTTCEHCGATNLTGRKIHWANISDLYKRVREDWLRLCAKCHQAFDKAKRFPDKVF